MLEMLTGMMGEAIDSVLEFIDNPYTMIADLVFHADQYIEKSLGVNGLNKLSDYLLMTGYLLIIIKFLRKILGQYILQMEGDVDVPPSALLERFVKAIIVAVGFRLAYEWGTEIGMDIIENSLSALSGVREVSLTDAVKTYMSGGFFLSATALAFVVMYFLLYLQFIRAGLEVLILRLGVSWACIGILESDEELFKTYIQSFFHSFFTVLVQLVLLKLALALLFRGQGIWALATMGITLSTPRFLQKFMIVSRGEGGLMSKAYYAGSMARSLWSVVKR